MYANIFFLSNLLIENERATLNITVKCVAG